MSRANLLKTCALSVALLCTGLMPSDAAENRKVLAHYETRLSERDHVSSKGKRLTTAAAVLQRDREHIYDSNRGKKNEYQDLEDVPDAYFVSKERLESFEQALARGHIEAATSKAILTATPMVAVTVYSDADGSVSIDVRYVRGGKTVVEESF